MPLFSGMVKMFGNRMLPRASRAVNSRVEAGGHNIGSRLSQRQYTTQPHVNPIDSFKPQYPSSSMPPVMRQASAPPAQHPFQFAHTPDGRIFGTSIEDMLGDLNHYRAAAQKQFQITEQDQIDRYIYNTFKKLYDIPDNAQPIRAAQVLRNVPPLPPPRVKLPPPLPPNKPEPMRLPLPRMGAAPVRVPSPPPPRVKPESVRLPLPPPSVKYDPVKDSGPTLKTPPPRPPRKDLATKSQMPNVVPAPPPRPPRLSVPLVAVRPVLGLGQRVSFLELFGWDLSKVTFKQHGGNTCYLLSSLDSILRNPNGWQILDKIKIHKNGDTYQVLFPGQRGRASEIIPVTEAELNRAGGVETAALGIRLIEQAYLKIPGVRAGRFDESANALTEIFGSRKLSAVSIQNSKNLSQAEMQDDYEIIRDFRHADGVIRPLKKLRDFEHHIGDFLIPHEERHAHFKQLIRHAHEQPEADVLTAIRIGEQRTVTDEARGLSYQEPTGDHYYSIRLHESTPEQVVLANPFDTSKPFQVPFEQFMQEYNIEGIRFSLT